MTQKHELEGVLLEGYELARQYECTCGESFSSAGAFNEHALRPITEERDILDQLATKRAETIEVLRAHLLTAASALAVLHNHTNVPQHADFAQEHFKIAKRAATGEGE